MPRRMLPQPVTGYVLNPARGWFNVIVPEEAYNLVANPSVELDTTGYTAYNAATLARVATQQRRGAYSLQVTPSALVNDGMFYNGVGLVAGNYYTFSLDFWGAGGAAYMVYFATSANALLGNAYRFKASGGWQRVHVTYFETLTATRRLFVVKDSSASVAPFYVDGLQVEQKAYPTTYCDGDQQGFLIWQQAYSWTGTPHASASYRAVDTWAGGRERSLQEDYGFRLLGWTGLGTPPMKTFQSEYADLSGSLYQRSLAAPRPFALVGAWLSQKLNTILAWKRGIELALDPVNIAPSQPVLLRYRQVECNQGDGAVDIPAVYTGGLEGNTDNLYQERTALAFFMPDPYAASEGDYGAVLGTGQLGGPSTNFAIGQDRLGRWGVFTYSDGNRLFPSLVPFRDRFMMYFAENITDQFLRYNLITGEFTNLGLLAGGNQQVSAVLLAADGSIYIGGDFTSVGGVSANNIARYFNGTWTALGTGTVGDVLALCIGSDGLLYVGGEFTSAGGVANTPRVARWSGSAWQALSNGANGIVHSIIDPKISNVAVLIGGAFTNIDGAGTNYLAMWVTTGPAWAPLEALASPSAQVRALVLDRRNGHIFAGGAFTTIGGVSAARVAEWQFNYWQAMGSGTDQAILWLHQDSSGDIIAAGSANVQFEGRTVPGRAAVWNGITWMPVPLRFAADPGNSHLLRYNRSSYFINSVTGNDLFPSSTELNNLGTAYTYPTFRFVKATAGPVTLYYIANDTTGAEVHFGGPTLGIGNLVLQQGEIVTLEIRPDGARFTSSVRGDLTQWILSGSDVVGLALKPGVNLISVMAYADVGVLEAAAWWRTRHGVVRSLP